mmetsp:Transcript_6279/g.11868  ORF Transcript_6279/g.11868 Transcript_6279/m.11868 type:complete len:88 (-) Transcript_6279:1049-1312(-)
MVYCDVALQASNGIVGGRDLCIQCLLRFDEDDNSFACTKLLLGATWYTNYDFIHNITTVYEYEESCIQHFFMKLISQIEKCSLVISL